MTRKKTDKKENKRAAPISWRPPTALQAEFQDLVERSGLSANAYITRAVFGAGSSLDKALLARLLGEAAQIHAALHEIALTGGDKPANTFPLEMALDDLTEIRAAILDSLGRHP